MKAKDLIEILSKHPEKEVKFFNSIVDDWMDIEIHDETLVKEKPSYLLERINATEQAWGRQLLTKKEVLKIKRNWQIPFNSLDFYTKKEVSFKEVFMIYTKSRNKTMTDRLGSVGY